VLGGRSDRGVGVGDRAGVRGPAVVVAEGRADAERGDDRDGGEGREQAEQPFAAGWERHGLLLNS